MTVKAELASTDDIEVDGHLGKNSNGTDLWSHHNSYSAVPSQLSDQDCASTDVNEAEDFITDDFSFIKVQCDRLRSSLKREKIYREEVEKENKRMLSELKVLSEKYEAKLLSHSEIQEQLHQQVLAKQRKINHLTLELKEMTEAFEQRNKRLEELRRTEQYWKEEVLALRNEILYKSKEASIYCSEIDRLTQEVKQRNSLFMRCCSPIKQLKIQMNHNSVVSKKIKKKPTYNDLENKYSEMEPCRNELEKVKLDETDRKPSEKKEDCEEILNIDDKLMKLDTEMQELSHAYVVEREESFQLLEKQKKEKEELCQKITELESMISKLKSEINNLKQERIKDLHCLETERGKVAILKQNAECLKCHLKVTSKKYLANRKKCLARGKQKEKEQRKKMEEMVRKHFAFEQELYSQLHNLRTRIKELLFENSNLKNTITEKDEKLSFVKLDLVKTKELLKTEAHINRILSEKNRVIQDELSACLNILNRSAGSVLYKSTYSQALGEFMKEWRKKMKKVIEGQEMFCIFGTDKEIRSTALRPFNICCQTCDSNIKSCAKKNAKLPLLELLEMENSSLHILIHYLQKKWIENVNCPRPIPLEDVCEEIKHSCIRARALLATLDQEGTKQSVQSRDSSLISSGIQSDIESLSNQTNQFSLPQDCSEEGTS